MGSSTIDRDCSPFIRPLLLPDEFGGWSHLGRLQALNGFRSIDATRLHLFTWTGDPWRLHGKGMDSLVKPLAAAVDLRPEEYLERHSLHYLSTAVWQPGQQRNGLRRALTLLRPRVYLCKKCVREDLQAYGMAYWHREHQLPGNYWCQIHTCPLDFVENTAALYNSPSQALSYCTKGRFSRMGDVRPRIVGRVLQIQKRLLAVHRPLDGLAVTRVLLIAAAREGVRDWRGANHTPFSDFLHLKFNSKWLCSVLPVFAEKQMGVRLETIDHGLSKGHASVTAFVVALAALYDAAPSEIDALLSNAPDSSLKSSTSPMPVAVDELRRVYVKERGRHRSVAKRLNWERSTTANRLNRIALPSLEKIKCIPSSSTMTPLQQLRIAMERFVKEGQAVGEACKGLDIDNAYFEHLLRSTARNLYQTTRLMA